MSEPGVLAEIAAEAREPFSHIGRGPVGVLVSHGFTGSPGSVRFLAQAFAQAGYHVECPCLSGHGTTWQDMVGCRAEDWIEDVSRAWEKLRQRSPSLFVVGFSMGGTLALHLAQQEPDLKGVILINHALILGNPLSRLSFLLKGVLDSCKAVGSDIKDPAVREPAYARTPVASIVQLRRLARMVRRQLRDV